MNTLSLPLWLISVVGHLCSNWHTSAGLGTHFPSLVQTDCRMTIGFWVPVLTQWNVIIECSNISRLNERFVGIWQPTINIQMKLAFIVYMTLYILNCLLYLCILTHLDQDSSSHLLHSWPPSDHLAVAQVDSSRWSGNLPLHSECCCPQHSH